MTQFHKFHLSFSIDQVADMEHKVGGDTGKSLPMRDFRGRPLQLPQDDEARRSLVQQWLYDMGGT
mgnify:CR=1 FL=1